MKILFLGTGADDWHNYDGADKRKNSGAIINENLLIDFSPAVSDYPKALKRIKNIIITHTHRDHFNADLLKEFIKENNARVYAESLSAKKISSDMGINVIPFKIGEEYEIDDYTIIPLAANHSVEDEKERPVHYIINDGDKKIFWGCDGGWLVNKTWHEIRKHKLNSAVFDCTIWDKEGDYRVFEHNNISMVKSLKKAFYAVKVIDDSSKIFATHFSKNAQHPHEKLCEILGEDNIITAYDGMEAEI
ncbi:MAG: MBL fold metallo-hydrolase [Clostridia bacterium]|nr:MBL fold metallo-hydrolase [Clostridia bacterium]